MQKFLAVLAWSCVLSFLTSECRAKNIYVTSAHACSEWSNEFALSRGYSKDGVAATPNSCFHSATKANQWATLNIPYSSVETVKLLSKGSEMKGTTVKICTSGSQCSQCGQPTNVASGGQWATFNCNHPISGNQIKVVQNNNYVAFCEVEIHGESAPKIYVTGGQASSEWDAVAGYTLSQGYSKEGVAASPATCFHSKTTSNQWAVLDIPSSSVEAVKLLSYESYLKGATVEICTAGLQCSQCGQPSNVASGGIWAKFSCDPPITGEKIKVVQNNNYVAFCEVEIHGKSADSVLSGSSSGSGSVCEASCTDYHKFCQKLYMANFVTKYAAFLASDEAKQMGFSQEPPEGNCHTSQFYQTHCPKTCERCNC